MASDPFSNLSEPEVKAARALVSDAGCLPDRARVLTDAVAQVAAADALDVIAGTAAVSTSVIDTRVSRLRKIVERMSDDESFPNAYELGVVFRVTAAQAQRVINTYQARYSAEYRGHMKREVEAALETAEAVTIDETQKWRVGFGDPNVLGFAYDTLKRRGLVKTLVRDTVAMTLAADSDQKDRHGLNAVEALRDEVE